MIKAILLTNSDERIDKVFNDERKVTLNKLYGCPKKAYIPESFERDREDFVNVEYIFSTWGMPVLTEEQIKCFPKLKAVFYAAGTVKAFAKPLLDNGIRVFSAWIANGLPVAEFTFAQIILANKGYYRILRLPYEKNYNLIADYKGNFNAAIGLLGMGAIGRAVAQMCKTMDYEVLVHDPYFSEEQAKTLGVRKAGLKEIFERCDVVSNHLPNLEELDGIINKELLSLMKPNATFINTGRGKQVNEKDLVDCMNAEKGRAALLDVTYPEPPLKDSDLFKCNNIFLTPHIAGSINDEVLRMADYMIQESINFENGNELKYEITAEMLKRMA